jgi:PPOX class probable F420-dependent enzyme
MDRTSLAAARIERFLETEPVVWLSTTSADGAPHLVPTWFAWDGSSIVIRSKPGAHKVRNLRANPRAMLALGDAEDDFDVGLVEAVAELEPGTGDAGATRDGSRLPAAFSAKYGERIAALGLTPAQFARLYSQTIRLIPRRALGWHGRSRPASTEAAARRVAAMRPLSIAEPPTAAALAGGEPIARRAAHVPVGIASSWRTWFAALARSLARVPAAAAG